MVTTGPGRAARHSAVTAVPNQESIKPQLSVAQWPCPNALSGESAPLADVPNQGPVSSFCVKW